MTNKKPDDKRGRPQTASEYLTWLRRKQEQRSLHWQERAAASRAEKKARGAARKPRAPR
jgi:hypothetical protein